VAQERGNGRFSPEHRVEREGQRIIERLESAGPAAVIALAATGKQVDSRQLATWVRQYAYDEGRPLAFVVGGPDGLSSAVLKKADRLLGLSRLTLPHDMARLFLTEQIYRSLTIIERHPYDR
jgi:23S rRNA (pseudouridine1915-N3)-methyltransferase